MASPATLVEPAVTEAPVDPAALQGTQTGEGPAAEPINRSADLATQIQEAFRKSPAKMTRQLANELGIGEAEVIRHLPNGRSTELDISRWEELIRSFESLEMVHVIVTNHACTIECFGSFGNFSKTGPFFNVQTKSIDMHIRFERLASVFAVVKPSHMDAHETLSFQFFDINDDAAFKVFLTFGGKEPPAQKRAAFDALSARFARKL